MFSCLVSSKYNMTAVVLSQNTSQEQSEGHWETKQDPDTGEIIRVWVEDSDPNTPGTQTRVIRCMIKGVIDGGIRVAGTTERFSLKGMYENVDFIKMSFGANDVLTKRDRITSVKGPDGEVIWKEEETDNAPTVFDVMGVTPITDPFGKHVENFALLQRADPQ